MALLKNGREATAFCVYENGEAGLVFYGNDQHKMFIGKSPANGQLKEKLNGIVLWNDTTRKVICNSQTNE